LGKAALQGYKWSREDKGLLIQFSRSDGNNQRKQRNNSESVSYLPPPHTMNNRSRGISNISNFPIPSPEFSSPLLATPLPLDSSSTLFVEGLPLDATEREVSHIFRRMGGFQSLRIIPKEMNTPQQRTYNLCFAEFDNKYQATMAMHQLQGYRMEKEDPRTAINISFAKKRKKNQGSSTNGNLSSNNNNNNSTNNSSNNSGNNPIQTTTTTTTGGSTTSNVATNNVANTKLETQYK